MGRKRVVLYASRTGTTQKIAQDLANRFEADLIKVFPQKDYGSFANAIMRVAKEKATNEQATSGTEFCDYSDYEIIFLGFPIWAGDVPTYFQDHILNSEFGGTTIVPFATSAFSSMANSIRTIKQLCPGSRIMYPFLYNRKTANQYPGWLYKLKSFLA